MLHRIFATGLLVLGAGVAANVVIGKLFSQRRGLRATGAQLPSDLDFTPEQVAMLALIRRQINVSGPVSGEVS
jgi:hypothetical protein